MADHSNDHGDDAEQAHPPLPPDDQARSPGSEEDELFERVVSSTARGSAEASSSGPTQLLSNLGSDEAEFNFTGSRSLSETPLEKIGQMDQSDPAVRATAATAFHFPAKPTYRGFSGGTMVAPQFPGLDGMSGAGFEPPSLRPGVGGAETGAASASAAAPPRFQGVPANTQGLLVPMLLPYYRLETHTHSSVTLSGSDTEVDAVNCINISLGAQGVDFEFKPHKAKWKCCHARDAVCVFFSTRLWKKSDAPKAYVLEFQRRHGDAASFMGFYRATVAALHASGMGPECKPRAAPATFGASSSQGLMGLQVPSMASAGVPTDVEIEGYVMPLCEMVESGLLDSALEATRALAQLSSHKDHRMAMHRCGVVAALVKFLDGANRGLLETAAQIFAIACLANMSEEPVVQSSLYGAAPMLLSHVNNGEYSDRAMRRECARTLRNLAQDDQGADAMIERCGTKTLESWCMDTLPTLEDQAMRQDAAIVREKVQARWPRA